jgi:hypothetical protein
MTDTAAAHAISLTTNINHQIQQACELRKLAYAVIVAEHKREFTRAQHLALILFYRGLQTHGATEILLRQRLVEDARVLVRVLVEHCVNCAYMLFVGDDQTATDFIKYPQYWKYKLLRDLRAVDETRLRKSVSAAQEEEIRKEYEALHPRFKDRRNGEWCVDGQLHKRAAKVDEKLSEQLGQAYIEFRWLVNSAWRFASSDVHGMADTLLEQVSHSEGVITVEQKYEPEDAAGTLYTANLAVSLALTLVDIVLGSKYANEILTRSAKFTGNRIGRVSGEVGETPETVQRKLE